MSDASLGHRALLATVRRALLMMAKAIEAYLRDGVCR